ncbi:hypothetical protein ACP4OV_020845 [Aristida adscensionis]
MRHAVGRRAQRLHRHRGPHRLPGGGGGGGGAHQDHFTVAELVPPAASSDGATATLRCFSSSSDGGAWIHKTLRAAATPASPWCTDTVLCYTGKLWWVDLSQGLLACDPVPASPDLRFVKLPNVQWPPWRNVVLTTRAAMPRIKVWTLADPDAGEWTLDYSLSCRDIWDDPSYNKTGLLNHVPRLALVHPIDSHVLFLFEGSHLYGFDMQSKALTDYANLGIDKEEASHTFALAWQLSPLLNVPAGRFARDNLSSSAFGTTAAAFGNVCDRAIKDMEFHQFTSENKFRVVEHISICYFDDQHNGEKFEYAHINFRATHDSKMILVFAEVSRKKGNRSNSWTLSSCKTLTKNSHDGLREDSVDVEGTQKRKRSLYCFACADKVKHPRAALVVVMASLPVISYM